MKLIQKIWKKFNIWTLHIICIQRDAYENLLLCESWKWLVWTFKFSQNWLNENKDSHFLVILEKKSGSSVR
jgi:hypothetical protein